MRNQHHRKTGPGGNEPAGHTVSAHQAGRTGKLVQEATSLPVTLYLHTKQGGAQQIAARIAYNEIDLVLFFCDPNDTEGLDELQKIERMCDQRQIPFATNAATAEVLIQGLRRGDFDWRDIVNPKKH